MKDGENREQTAGSDASRAGETPTTTRTLASDRTARRTTTTADTSAAAAAGTGSASSAGSAGAAGTTDAGADHAGAEKPADRKKPRYLVDGRPVSREAYLKAAEERNWDPRFLVERNYFPAL